MIRRLYNLLIGDIAEILREMVGELAPMGRLLFRFGVVFALLSAWMAGNFGLQVSVQHAIGLAAVALMVAFVPHAAHYLWSVKGEKGAAIAAVIGTFLFGTIELTSHLGYTSASRAMNVGEATVQNATYTGSQKAVGEDEEALKRARSDIDQLKLANPWSTTVTAEALRAQLPPLEAELKREASNCGQRKCRTPDEGKGPAWQLLAQQKADIEGKIAIAEERNGIAIRIADLEKRLGERRAVAATTQFKHSAVENSTAFISNIVRVINGGEKPSPFVQQLAELIWTALQAVGFALAAMFCFWLAGRFRLDLAKHFPPGRPEAFTEPAPTQIRSMATAVIDDFFKNVNKHVRAIPGAREFAV